MRIHTIIRTGCTFIALLCIGMCQAQTSDKVDADKLLFETLQQTSIIENYHEPLVITSKQLQQTNEKNIFLVKGESFQVKSLCSDFYVTRNKEGEWIPLCDQRYPLETAVNLMLNKLDNNRHPLHIIHHQYGNKKKEVTLPMQALFDALARNMRLYSTVTRINEKEMEALLVFHHPKLNYIHMLQMTISIPRLLDPEYTIDADLYSNIPQDNVKSIFHKHANKK